MSNAIINAKATFSAIAILVAIVVFVLYYLWAFGDFKQSVTESAQTNENVIIIAPENVTEEYRTDYRDGH